MYPQPSLEPAGYRPRVPGITWEEELFLCGVRPDSELVSLLHPSLLSSQCRGDGSGVGGLVGSSAIRAVVSGGCGNCMGVGVTGVGQYTEKRNATLSPLRSFSTKPWGKEYAASPGEESVVCYSSDGGLSTATCGRAVPVSLSSPRVIVPSLMSIPDSVPRPDVQKDISSLRSLPPLINDGCGRESNKLCCLSLEGNRQRLAPTMQSRPFSSSVIPIRDTEATLSGMNSATVSYNLFLSNKDSAVPSGEKTPLVPVSCWGTGAEPSAGRRAPSCSNDKRDADCNKTKCDLKVGLRAPLRGTLPLSVNTKRKGVGRGFRF